MSDLEVLARGLLALRELDRHAQDYLGCLEKPRCQDCARFAVALLRGAAPEDQLHLRCPETQLLHRQVQEAFALAEMVLG
jgi:chromosome condensin MukBEF MukE localization factor